LREWRTLANDAYKLLQSIPVCVSRLFTARLIHEVQKGVYCFFCECLGCFHNDNYIRRETE
jgi:hypothetical protein